MISQLTTGAHFTDEVFNFNLASGSCFNITFKSF